MRNSGRTSLRRGSMPRLRAPRGQGSEPLSPGWYPGLALQTLRSLLTWPAREERPFVKHDCARPATTSVTKLSACACEPVAVRQCVAAVSCMLFDESHELSGLSAWLYSEMVMQFVPTQVRQPVAAVRGWYSWPRLHGEHLEYDRVPAAKTSKGPISAGLCSHLRSHAVQCLSTVHQVHISTASGSQAPVTCHSFSMYNATWHSTAGRRSASAALTLGEAGGACDGEAIPADGVARQRDALRALHVHPAALAWAGQALCAGVHDTGHRLTGMPEGCADALQQHSTCTAAPDPTRMPLAASAYASRAEQLSLCAAFTKAKGHVRPATH